MTNERSEQIFNILISLFKFYGHMLIKSLTDILHIDLEKGDKFNGINSASLRMYSKIPPLLPAKM